MSHTCLRLWFGEYMVRARRNGGNSCHPNPKLERRSGTSRHSCCMIDIVHMLSEQKHAKNDCLLPCVVRPLNVVARTQDRIHGTNIASFSSVQASCCPPTGVFA